MSLPERVWQHLVGPFCHEEKSRERGHCWKMGARPRQDFEHCYLATIWKGRQAPRGFASLRCSVCQRFEDRIKSSQNFSPAFVDGTSNLRTSSFKDHAKSDMHPRAMHLLKREQSTNVSDYAQVYYRMDQTVEKQRKMKFDVAYMIAKEGIAFTKTNSCQLPRSTRCQVRWMLQKWPCMCYFCRVHSTRSPKLTRWVTT